MAAISQSKPNGLIPISRQDVLDTYDGKTVFRWRWCETEVKLERKPMWVNCEPKRKQPEVEPGIKKKIRKSY